MRAFIKSSGVISPQLTHAAVQFPEEITEITTNRLICVEPEYRNLINPLLLRRMPRILKMGLAASQLCVSRAGGINPDGIIVGTGLGCIDNLEKFLMDVIDNNEHVTSVLPFINSTHNAVAAQISMLLRNHNYNTTYCHRGFSFESALHDGMMLIHENPSYNVLVGGIDECTDDFWLLHSYLNDWKQPVSNLSLLSERTPGTIAGEGSSFFILSNEPQGDEGISVEGIHTFYTSEIHHVSEIENEITTFIEKLGVQKEGIHAVLLGLNGDFHNDRFYYDLADNLFAGKAILWYKHLCGEYYTSSAFAVWLGSVMLGQGPLPEPVVYRSGNRSGITNLLFYNQINNTEHSLIFMKYGRL